MKRATVTIPDEIERALDSYLADQPVPLALTALMQSALRAYLADRGYLPPAQPLRITPSDRGSGQHDTSAAHDQILAE